MVACGRGSGVPAPSRYLPLSYRDGAGEVGVRPGEAVAVAVAVAATGAAVDMTVAAAVAIGRGA